MKCFFFLTLFILTARAGFLSSDFKPATDNPCIMDLKPYKKAHPVLPEKYELICIVHEKNPALRVCEGGDEFEFKESNNDTYKSSLIHLKAKFFKVAAKGIRTSKEEMVDSDKIFKVTKNLSCEERLKWANCNRMGLIQNKFGVYDPELGDIKKDKKLCP